MTPASLTDVPAPASGCRITVVIPARNESALIGQTLAALTAQCDLDGAPLPRDFFDVIVLANNCRDETAAIARAVATQSSACDIFVVEATFEREHAHIGTARKAVMDVAATRFTQAHHPDGIIASIDSDTIADRNWIAQIARESRAGDAVAGVVTIAAADQERLLAPVRLLYARELAYRRALADVETLLDPLLEDPAPRHGSFVGASFAVKTGCYLAAGGLPPLPRLEDVEFSLALRRIDARVRHSVLVRATTSARLVARVSGGFGSFIAGLHDHARRAESFSVEHPLRSLEDIESRAALRRIWLGSERSNDAARIAAIFNDAPERWRPLVNRCLPFGRVYEHIAQYATRRAYAPMPVEPAIRILRGAALRLQQRSYGGVSALAHDEPGVDGAAS